MMTCGKSHVINLCNDDDVCQVTCGKLVMVSYGKLHAINLYKDGVFYVTCDKSVEGWC